MNIYVITNNVNGKQYVGLTTKSIEERFQKHKYTALSGGGYYLHNAMRKYGVENFSLQYVCSAQNIEELKEKEIAYIAKFNTFHEGYNLTKGGDFTSNNGKVVVKNELNENVQIDIEEFLDNREHYRHVNEGMITIFKHSNKMRVTTNEYKEKYFKEGWRSKNYGFVTVKLLDGTITKIRRTEFDKNLHKGISSETQTYYNSLTGTFERLTKNEVNLEYHYNKNKVRYLVYDNNGKLIDKNTAFEKIKIESGLKQFAYMKSRMPKEQKEWILTEDIISKLKNKYKDFSFVGYKLVKEKL